MSIRNRLSLSIFLLAFLLSPLASFAQTESEAMLVQARQHFEKGEYYFATTWFERFLKSNPSSPQRKDVLLLMSKAYLASGREEKAAKTLATLIKDYPDAANSLDPQLLKLAKEGVPAVPAPSVLSPSIFLWSFFASL